MRERLSPSVSQPTLRRLKTLRNPRILITLALLALLGSTLYMWMLRQRAEQLTLAATTREVHALLAGIELTGPRASDAAVNVDGIRLYPELDAVPVATLDAFDRDALDRLRHQPSHPISVAWPESNPTELRHVAVLRDGRVAFVVRPLSVAATGLDRHLAQTWFTVGSLLFLLLGGLTWIFFAARRDLVEMQSADGSARARVLQEVFLGDAPSEPNRVFPWIIAATVPTFILDIWLGVPTLAGAIYVVAVMTTLSRPQTWRTLATAGWGALLLFVAPLVSPGSRNLWDDLQAHAFVSLFIFGTAIFGLMLKRRSINESLAIANAAQAETESQQLRVALERASAADARMRTALDRLTLATQFAGISVWEWDLVSDLIHASEGSNLGARLGSNTHLRGGDYIRNFVYAEDRDAFANAFRPAISGERADGQIMHRYRALSSDGSVEYIQLHARLYRDESGRPVRIVGVDWNVTREVRDALELARQTEQLRDAERRLERASLSSLEGHWETDLLTGQAWVSSSFRELLGFAPGEFEAMGIAAPELAHPEDRARQEAAYLAHLQKGTPFDLQLRLCDARGQYRWFRIQGAAERDDDGRPVRISGSIQDIAEQRRAEEALREVQARFERAINGTQDGLFDWDVVNDSVWLSPRYQKMLGYEPDELTVRVSGFSQHMHPDDVGTAEKAFVDLVKTGKFYDHEYRLRKKNGDYLWVRVRAVAQFGRDGRAIRLSGSAQDITETRRAREQLLEAMTAANAANEAKSVFLATMSHEIRTPLNGVIGMTGLLLDTDLSRPQREYANTIRTSAESLLHVINDVLDFSKIEAGKLEIDATEMDLRANVEDVCAIMALQAAAKQIELVVDVREEVPEIVRGDAQRVRQCLLNLLSNAVKFTSAGEIVVHVCVLAQQAGRTLLQFSVRDTGIGLSHEQAAALFKPFVQADASTTKQFGGSGLGLSIVKRLVELMHGQVGVESELGHGATFWFTLPLEPLDPSGKFGRLATATLGRRVLAVDDNETNRAVLGNQLQRVGYAVELAADGADALRRLKAAADEQRPFDIALIDFQMPSMDGAALGEAIVSDSTLSNTRLVLLTSLDRAGDQERFAAIGFAAYLAKPVRARDLRDCLERVLAAEARDWHLRSQPIVTRSILADSLGKARYGGRVLLVEDNVVNLQVAQRYLERLGCEVVCAQDGAAAVSAFKEKRFHLVLMDMQMPVMDGLTATIEIRRLERGARRTPIVALTANVMAGQVERCLEAGMNDFLGKPIDVNRLRDVLERFGLADLNADSAESESSETPEVLTHGPPLNLARVAAIAEGDVAFAAELLRTFAETVQTVTAALVQAIADQDRDALAREAHKLKGAAGNVGADRLQQLVEILHNAAAEAAFDDLARTVTDIQVEARSVLAVVPNPSSP